MVCLLLRMNVKTEKIEKHVIDRRALQRSDQLLVVFLAYFYISRVAAILMMDLTFMSQLSCFFYVFSFFFVLLSSHVIQDFELLSNKRENSSLKCKEI